MITMLAGGVGAARFLEGLVAVVPPETITAVVNTGDDMVLHGLHIAPDLDIVLCTLAGLIDQQRGWGIANDTGDCLEWLGRLGAPTWFFLGDRDLALHIQRTALLGAGHTLSQVTETLRHALGVPVRLLPMCETPTPTHILTPSGAIHFEEYLVKHGARDTVMGVEFVGIEEAIPAPGVLEALTDADVVIVAPSNPVVSIGPILAVPGVRQALQQHSRPVVAVSPIVAGKAIKGPAAAMMQAVGLPVSAVGVAQAYHDIVDILVIDQQDADLQPAIEALGMRVVVTDTIMRDIAAKKQLAHVVMGAAL